MAFDPSTHTLDDLDWSILAELQADGRIAFSELGRRVALSAPAVTERVRRLEAAGVVTGYRAVVDPVAVGYAIEAIVRVRDDTNRIGSRLGDLVEVLEAVHVTGEDCWVVRVIAPDMARLEELVGELGSFGPTTTSLVFSAPVRGRAVAPVVSADRR